MTDFLLRIFLTLSFSGIYFNLSAQAWSGYETGNYSGLHALGHQPAEIAQTPYQWEINIASLNMGLFGQDFIPNYNILNNLNGNIVANYRELKKLSANRLVLKMNFLLPSVMYTIDDRSAAAFSWGKKAFGIYKVSDGPVLQILNGELDADLENIQMENELSTSKVYAWTEFNLSYARVVYDKDLHKLKVGGTAKLLQGIGEFNYNLANIELKMNGDSSLEYLNANLSYRYSDKIAKLADEGNFDLFGSTGFGADLGLVYEFKDKRPWNTDYPYYRFKVGFSATDIGLLRFKAARQRSVTVSVKDLSLSRFRDIESFTEFTDTLDAIFGLEEIEDPGKYSLILPTQFNLFFDYNFGNNFFLSVQQFYRLNNLDVKEFNIGNTYKLTVTPRYEDKRYGVYLPVSYDNILSFNAGLGLRWKGIAIGSSNIFSRWFYDENETVGDLYVVFKVPLVPKEDRMRQKRKRKEISD